MTSKNAVSLVCGTLFILSFSGIAVYEIVQGEVVIGLLLLIIVCLFTALVRTAHKLTYARTEKAQVVDVLCDRLPA